MFKSSEKQPSVSDTLWELNNMIDDSDVGRLFIYIIKEAPQ